MFKSKNKKNVEEYIDSTYPDIVFNGKIEDMGKEDIEKALDKAYQEKNNEVNEYYKLLTFFWGIQISALAISSQFLFFLLKNKNDNDIIMSISSIVFCISILSSFITFLQFYNLTLKKSRIISFLYHIILIEYILNRNISSVVISNDKLSYIEQLFPFDFKILIFVLKFIWNVCSAISLGYYFIIKFNLNDKNILCNIILVLLFAIFSVIQFVLSYYMNKHRKAKYKIGENTYADIILKINNIN